MDTMKNVYSDNEVLSDGLDAEKSATDYYNTFSNECAHEHVRSTVLNLLAKEHDLQNDVFQMMTDRNLYPTPAAQEDKVEQAKQKFNPQTMM